MPRVPRSHERPAADIASYSRSSFLMMKFDRGVCPIQNRSTPGVEQSRVTKHSLSHATGENVTPTKCNTGCVYFFITAVALFSNAAFARQTVLPQKVCQCVNTTITSITDRFGEKVPLVLDERIRAGHCRSIC